MRPFFLKIISLTNPYFNQVLDNSVPIENQKELEFLGEKFGRKTANMLLLNSIASDFNRDKKPSIPIEIPPFFGLADDFVGHFFNQLSDHWNSGTSRDGIVAYIKSQAGESSEIVRTAHELCEKKFGKDAVIMIRSTGNEDEEGVPNPGGNDSESYVSINPKSISLAIINVLTSYFSEKSFLQRQALADISVMKLPKLSLLFQVQIREDMLEQPSIVSGVGITSTMEGYLGGVTQISATYGHGSGVVDGTLKVATDQFYMTSRGVFSVINEKVDRSFPQKSSVHKLLNHPDVVSKACLTREEACGVNDFMLFAKQYFGGKETSLDFEFVLQKSSSPVLHFVQGRELSRDSEGSYLDLPKRMGAPMFSVASNHKHPVVCHDPEDDVLIASNEDVALNLYLQRVKEGRPPKLICLNCPPSNPLSHPMVFFKNINEGKGLPVVYGGVIARQLRANKDKFVLCIQKRELTHDLAVRVISGNVPVPFDKTMSTYESNPSEKKLAVKKDKKQVLENVKLTRIMVEIRKSISTPEQLRNNLETLLSSLHKEVNSLSGINAYKSQYEVLLEEVTALCEDLYACALDEKKDLCLNYLIQLEHHIFSETQEVKHAVPMSLTELRMNTILSGSYRRNLKQKFNPKNQTRRFGKCRKDSVNKAVIFMVDHRYLSDRMGSNQMLSILSKALEISDTDIEQMVCKLSVLSSKGQLELFLTQFTPKELSKMSLLNINNSISDFLNRLDKTEQKLSGIKRELCVAEDMIGQLSSSMLDSSGKKRVLAMMDTLYKQFEDIPKFKKGDFVSLFHESIDQLVDVFDRLIKHLFIFRISKSDTLYNKFLRDSVGKYTDLLELFLIQCPSKLGNKKVFSNKYRRQMKKLLNELRVKSVKVSIEKTTTDFDVSSIIIRPADKRPKFKPRTHFYQLDDVFTTVHQSLVALAAGLKRSKIGRAILSVPLEAFESTIFGKSKNQKHLMVNGNYFKRKKITRKSSGIKCEYTLPLRTHSLVLRCEHNYKSGDALKISLHFDGLDEANRWSDIKKIADLFIKNDVMKGGQSVWSTIGDASLDLTFSLEKIENLEKFFYFLECAVVTTFKVDAPELIELRYAKEYLDRVTVQHLPSLEMITKTIQELQSCDAGKPNTHSEHNSPNAS